MRTTNQIPIGSRRRFLPQEVILLTADVNYTKVFLLDGRRMTVSTTLKILENRFAACTDFFRTHKSFLINLNYVKSLDSFNNETFIEMQNGFRVSVSRRKKKALRKMLFENSVFENYL
jgi:DNA-binding LytR/AlgR family response regulator